MGNDGRSLRGQTHQSTVLSDGEEELEPKISVNQKLHLSVKPLVKAFQVMTKMLALLLVIMF